MEFAGFICFIWAIAFTIACMPFSFTSWQEWDLTQPVIEDTWCNIPKGLAIAPLIGGLIWPSSTGKFSFEDIPFVFWERCFLTMIGILLGAF